MKQSLNIVGKFIGTYILMVVLFFSLVYVAFSIPHELTDSNIRKSLQILSDEGKFPWVCNNILWAKDNCTDGTMYNIAVSEYDMTPLEAAIMTPRTIEFGSDTLTSDYGLLALDRPDGTVPRDSYGRYWHGYQFMLKTGSTVTTIKGIRLFNIILLWGLLAFTGVMIWRRFGGWYGIGWILCFLIMGYTVVPLSMQYVGCYYIMFASVLLMLYKPGCVNNGLLFFVIGGVTSFIDFLTIPMLTLGVPLYIAALIKGKNLTYQNIFRSIVCWGLGYASIWASKWLIILLYVGLSQFDAGTIFTGGHTLFEAIDYGYTHKYMLLSIVLLSIVLLCDVTVYFISRHRSIDKGQINKLFLISLIPFGWYLAMLLHSAIHIWFTYRALTVTLLCCVAMLKEK